MGNLAPIPVLGYNLPKYLPLLLIATLLFIFLNIHKKFLQVLGIEVFEFKKGVRSSKILIAEDILKEEREKILVKDQKRRKKLYEMF